MTNPGDGTTPAGGPPNPEANAPTSPLPPQAPPPVTVDNTATTPAPAYTPPAVAEPPAPAEAPAEAPAAPAPAPAAPATAEVPTAVVPAQATPAAVEPTVPAPAAYAYTPAPVAVAPAPAKRGHAGAIILAILLVLALAGGGFVGLLYKQQRDQTVKGNTTIVADQAKIADLQRQLDSAKSQLATAQSDGQKAATDLATCKQAVQTLFSSTDPAAAQAAAVALLQACK